MTMREGHTPTTESNSQARALLKRFLKGRGLTRDRLPRSRFP